jgi:hypothetical protein
MESEQLTQEQLQEIWNEEQVKLEADDGAGETSHESVEASGDEPLEVDAGAPEPEESESEAVAEEVDPFEGLPEAVKSRLAELDQLKATQAQLLHHIKTTEGRVAAMQREADQARRAAQAVASSDAPSQKQISSAAKNPEKWEQLKQDFPEWAVAMEEYVQTKLSGISVPQNVLQPQQVADFVQQQIGEARTHFAKALEETLVESRHENWKSTVRTPDFSNWFAIQKPEIQALANSPISKDAIRLLDLYSSAKAKPASEIKQERGQRLAAAASTRPGTTRPPKALDDLSPGELWNYMAQQREKEKAQRGF